MVYNTKVSLMSTSIPVISSLRGLVNSKGQCEGSRIYHNYLELFRTFTCDS